MKQTFSKLWQYIKKYISLIIFSLILSVISVLITLYIPIIVADAIDFIVGKNAVDFMSVNKLLIKIGILAIIGAVLQWGINVINNKVTFYITRDLRNRALEKLEKLPLKYIDSHSHGDIVSRVISDVDQISDGLLMGFTQIFTGSITIIFTIIFMIYVNYIMAIIVVVLTPLSLFVAKYISSKTYKLFKKQSEIRGEETTFLNEMITNQRTVIAFGEEENNVDKFEAINNSLEDISKKAIFFSSITNPSTRFINNVVYAGVVLSGSVIAIAGRITVGGLSAFLSYATQYTKPFNEISGVVTELQNAYACAERILSLIDEQEESKEAEESLKNATGNVEIKDVDFGYTDSKLILKNLDLDVKSGQKIAIVGPTGCGKTTLINLLMRFYDVNSGEIFVDGINIKDVTRKSLRNSFGMVLQDTWIKYGTVLENIKLGKKDATYEEVKKAAKSAMAYDFIKRLPNGFDTVVDDNDGILSEGERQLISIARIMLMNPPILILDEATSNIDTRTELKIQEAFDEIMKGRTCFIVAHRLSTIVSADVIVVLKDGRIIEKGAHKELVEQNGFYAELYNSQFSG